MPNPFRYGVGVCAVAVWLSPLAWTAETTSARPPAAKATSPSTARAPVSAGKAGARGLLPDPALLDGSTQPAEKKSEYGMIGDFELPGDENVKNGRAGGPQAQGQQGQGAQPQQPGGGGGLPNVPPQGGAGQQAQSGNSGQPPAGQQNPAGNGNPVAGAGDPNAKADGVQMKQLGGEGSDQSAVGEKPPAVAIGDSAMRIQTAATSPGVVGNQQQVAPNTQQHEKTGSGGKGPASTGGSNKVEKGRTIPAGL